MKLRAIAFLTLICICVSGFGQKLSHFRYSPIQGKVKDIASFGDTILFASDAKQFGFPMQNFTMLNKQLGLRNHNFNLGGADADQVISDGKGGYYVSGPDFYAYRKNDAYEDAFHVNANGEIDTLFNLELGFQPGLTRIQLDDSLLYAAGRYWSGSTIHRFNAKTGELDNTWATNIERNIGNFFIDDNYIYVRGNFRRKDSTETLDFGRINKLNGQWEENNIEIDDVYSNSDALADADSVVLFHAQVKNSTQSLCTFNNVTNSLFPTDVFNHIFKDGDVVYGVTTDDDGNLFVAGNFSIDVKDGAGNAIQLKNLIKINANHELDSSFHPFKNYSKTIEKCGNLEFVNNSLIITTVNAFATLERIYRVDLSSGLLDESWSFKANENVDNILALSQDSIICYGAFSTVNNATHHNMFLLVNGNLEATGLNLINYSVNWVDYNPANRQEIYIAGNGYLNNGFSGKLMRYNLKNQTVDQSFEPTFNSDLNQITLRNDTIFALGWFNSVNAISVKQFALLDLDGNVLNENNSIDNGELSPQTMSLYGDKIVVHSRDYVRSFELSDLSYTGWQLNNESSRIIGTKILNNKLFVYGSFQEFYPLPDYGNGIFKVNKSLPTLEIDNSFKVFVEYGGVSGIHPNDDGSAFIYGSFSNINYQPDSSFVKISIASGETLPWTLDPSIARKQNFKDLHLHNDTLYAITNDSIYAINNESGQCFWRMAVEAERLKSILVDDNNLVVAGRLAKGIKTKESNYIVAYVPTKDSLFSLNFKLEAQNLVTYATVNALEIVNDTLYFGGEFAKLDGSNHYAWGMYNLRSQKLIAQPDNFNPSKSTRILDIESDETHVYFLLNNTIHALNRATGSIEENILNISFANQDYLDLIESNSGVYLIGDFENINSAATPYFNIAKLKNGQLDTEWRLPKISNTYSGSFLSHAEETSDFLYIGGDFKLDGLGNQKLHRINLKTLEWDPTFNVEFSDYGSQFSERLTEFDISGGRLFAGGDFSKTNGKYTGGLSEISLNYGFTEAWAPFLDRGYDLSKIEVIKSQLFVVNPSDNVLDESYYGGSMFTFDLDPNFHAYRIDKIEPAQGNNLSQISVNITGLGFKQNSQVLLRKNGQEIVLNKNNHFIEDRFIQAQIDLSAGVELGFYDVVVKTANGDELVLPSGFEVIEYEHPVYYTDIISQAACLKEFWQEYTIVVKNESAQDILSLPVNLGVDKKADINFTGDFYSFNAQDSSLIHAKNLNAIAVDSLGGSPFDGKVYSWIIPVLPAQSEKKITYSAKYPIATDTNLVIAWADRPLHHSTDSLNKQIESCFNYIVSNRTTIPVANQECVVDQLNNGYALVSNVLQNEEYRLYLSGWGNGNNAGYGETYFDVNQMLDTLSANCNETTESIQQLYQFGWNADQQDDSLQSYCSTPFYPQPFDFKNIPVLASIDPNDKTGPLGLFSAGILNNHEKLFYRIRFENDSSATAPAQIVTIIDTLDQAVFNVNSVVFEDVKFAGFEYHAKPGATFIDDKIDLRPKFDVLAHIEAKVQEGIITWVLTAIDPITLERTPNPFEGLLPANKTSPEGQGSVFFNVKLKQPIPDNLEIKNKADIIFDANDTITTNEYFNLIDKIDPVSTVDDLPAQIDSTRFYIPIDGFDAESGILRYDVYAARNNEGFSYVGSTTSDSILFTGINHSIYHFYSIATDSAGNVENKSQSPEATVEIGNFVGTKDFANDANNIQIFPNPATNELHLVTIGEQEKILDVLIYSRDGRLVHTIRNAQNSQVLVTIDHLTPGAYLVKTTTDKNNTFVRKLLKN